MDKPQSKIARLRDACLELILEHKADGAIPTNGRFLFYELEQKGVIPKKYVKADGTLAARQPAQDISDALTDLRERGLVPWSWIVDELRSLNNWEFASSAYEYAVNAVEYARIDLWGGEPAPLIICESGAVHGVLRNLAGEYLVPITATKGQCKGHIVNEIAPLLVDEGRMVAYIGDHELRGPADQIESHTRRAIEEHAYRTFDAASWQRIALTQAQVNRSPRLKAEIIEKKDKRYKPPKPYKAIECEAIKQKVLVRLVRAWLDARLPEPLNRVRAREKAQRADIAAKLANL